MQVILVLSVFMSSFFMNSSASANSFLLSSTDGTSQYFVVPELSTSAVNYSRTSRFFTDFRLHSDVRVNNSDSNAGFSVLFGWKEYVEYLDEKYRLTEDLYRIDFGLSVFGFRSDVFQLNYYLPTFQLSTDGLKKSDFVYPRNLSNSFGFYLKTGVGLSRLNLDGDTIVRSAGLVGAGVRFGLKQRVYLSVGTDVLFGPSKRGRVSGSVGLESEF